MLSKEALQDFKKIYQEEFGEELTDDDALKIASDILTLFHTIYRPIKEEWLFDIKRQIENNN